MWWIWDFHVLVVLQICDYDVGSPIIVLDGDFYGFSDDMVC
jgi:hypothetical protein